MDEFNNINNSNNNSQNEYNKPFTDYQKLDNKPEDHFVHQSADEVAYNPLPATVPARKKKHGAGVKVLKAVGCVLCVLVISFGSVAGYVALTENGYKIPFISSNDADEHETEETEDIISEPDTIRTEDLPTIVQAASKENALTVPEIVAKVKPSVVGVSATLSNGTLTGTGIIMTQDGYIVTNNHVVKDALSVSVALLTDVDNDVYEEYPATIIGSDEETDLAVIKIDNTGLSCAEFGTSDDLLVGELAIAIGNPLGYDFASSVTAGIISGLNRDVTIEDREMTLIQTDAAINEGNSGGPLVNSYGQVIGINSAKISQLYAESLGFAIPIDSATPIINDLIQFGYVTGRPSIGITGTEITQYQSLVYNIPQGVYIVSVSEDSGAKAAGLQKGDIIFGVEGQMITTMAELNDYKGLHSAGDTIKLFIYRDGDTFDVDVKLTETTPAKG